MSPRLVIFYRTHIEVPSSQLESTLLKKTWSEGISFGQPSINVKQTSRGKVPCLQSYRCVPYFQLYLTRKNDVTKFVDQKWTTCLFWGLKTDITWERYAETNFAIFVVGQNKSWEMGNWTKPVCFSIEERTYNFLSLNITLHVIWPEDCLRRQ